MFFFVTLSICQLFEPGSYIKESLSEGQTFIIETGDTMWNNTIVIPRIDDLKVNYVQGGSSLGMALGGSGMNGIVGYGQKSVKAIVQATKATTLEAYVSGTEFEEHVATRAIIFTDPNFVVKISNNDLSLGVYGFFPEKVEVSIKTETKSFCGWWFTSSMTYHTRQQQMPAYFISASSDKSVEITVSPLSQTINSPAVYAYVNGTKNGALIKFGESQSIDYTPNYKPTRPVAPPMTQSYTDTPTISPTYIDGDIHIGRVEMESPFFVIVYIIIITILGAVLIYAIFKACKKARRECAEREAIPPVLSQVDPQMAQPLTSPYETHVIPVYPAAPKRYVTVPVAKTPKAYAAPKPVYVYPQVNAAYPQI
jgi:hypothetical protein